MGSRTRDHRRAIATMIQSIWRLTNRGIASSYLIFVLRRMTALKVERCDCYRLLAAAILLL